MYVRISDSGMTSKELSRMNSFYKVIFMYTSYELNH